MAEGASQRDQMTKPKFQASQRAMSKAFVSIFKWPDLGPPTGDCPNQIVSVGQSPTHTASL